MSRYRQFRSVFPSLRRRWLVVIAAVSAIIVAAGPTIAFKPTISGLEPTDVKIEATEISHFARSDPGKRRFGELTFLGGLVLKAPDSEVFGGYSGLALSRDGKEMIAVSDNGAWLQAEIKYLNGRPSEIADSRIGPLRATSGRSLTSSRNRDAEALTLVSGRPTNGTIQVAFERNYRIAVYKVTREGVSPTVRLLARPAGAAQMESNRGYEAITVLQSGPFKGATVAFAERLKDDGGAHTGWIWYAGKTRKFNLSAKDGFDVTDMAADEHGDIYVLERKFSWLEGIHCRIRRVSSEDVKPGARLQGEVLLTADASYEIDNMEGLAVSTNAAGQTILTLISDDNFNQVLQRTVLLQFAVNRKARHSDVHRAE